MTGDDVGNALSPKWARVVETVLAGGTQEAQAARLGVSRRTLTRYLARPEVQRELAAQARAAMTEAARGVQMASGEAEATLRRLLTCGVPTVELGAARAILEFGLKIVELERITALEAAVRELQEAR